MTYAAIVHYLAGFFAANIVVAGLSFMIRYTARLRWWEAEAGRHLMAVTGALVAAGTLLILPFIFGRDYPGRPILGDIVLGTVAAATWWRLAMLNRYLRKETPMSHEPIPGAEPAATPAAGPTQTRHPMRATLRTTVAALVGLAAVMPFIEDTIHLTRVWPWFAVVIGVAAGITRVLAIPQVEQWIRDNKLTGWLSAAPKR